MKQTVLIKSAKTKINVHSTFLQISNEGYSDTIIGYKNIQELYINKLVNLCITDAIKLASIFDVFFINQYGDILAKVMIYEKG